MTFLSLELVELRVVVLVSWAAPLAALLLMSGAGQRFSTWNTRAGSPAGRSGP
jgi:hypothetical protein